MDSSHNKPEQEPVGVMVSMDVSKGDEPEYRIFGRIYEVQRDGEGFDEVTYLAIEDSRNFDIPQHKPLPHSVMVKHMKESCDSMEMRGAFADGWMSAEAAHGIKGDA